MYEHLKWKRNGINIERRKNRVFPESYDPPKSNRFSRGESLLLAKTYVWYEYFIGSLSKAVRIRIIYFPIQAPSTIFPTSSFFFLSIALKCIFLCTRLTYPQTSKHDDGIDDILFSIYYTKNCSTQQYEAYKTHHNFLLNHKRTLPTYHCTRCTREDQVGKQSSYSFLTVDRRKTSI